MIDDVKCVESELGQPVTHESNRTQLRASLAEGRSTNQKKEIRSEPAFDVLHNEPRFQALTGKLALP